MLNKMLQNDGHHSNASPQIPIALLSGAAGGKQADIAKRLEQLNKWQEEQKKLLTLRQNMQRQMLGMEQKTMYQMLGLQSDDDDLSEMDESRQQDIMQAGGGHRGGYAALEKYDEYEEQNESHVNYGGQVEEQYDDMPTMRSADPDPSSHKTLTSGYGTEEPLEAPVQKSKKPFLKRGQGLKQRFKIDPEELRLNNLPRYKYANAHPKLKLKPPRLPKQQSKPAVAAAIPRPPSPVTVTTTLDAHEKRFQQLLMSSKNVCNSTPDTKSSLMSSKNLSGLSSTASSSSSLLPKVRFVEASLTNTKHNQEYPPSEGSPIVQTSAVAWSKILDSQQNKPLPIERKSLSPSLPQSEEDIFELMEQKAKNGSFDMDSTCIKQFMMQRRVAEKFDDTDVIPINDHLKTKRLQPLVGAAVRRNESTSSLEEEAEDSSIVPNTTELDEETTQKTLESTNSPYPPTRTTENRVRFSESHDTREFHQEDTVTDSSNFTNTVEAEGDATNNEFFEQFKQALFAALQDKADQHNNETSDTTTDTTLTPRESFINQDSHADSQASRELQEKTNMIKLRLMELEKEIATFKENNVQLMKAKQEHELEKSLHAQEQLEAAERLKDERIQMEIYLHDERMKFEEEKRKFEQQLKMKSQSSASKERKEVEKLKEQVAQLEAQLKSKDCNHAAAQARWRNQTTAWDREEKRLHEQIEILTKENKRLENEILKATRENNNKLLQEINRNIAKLAPKNSHHASAPFPDEDQPPVLASTRNMSKTIVAAAAANRNSKSSPKMQKRTKKSTKTSNNRLLKQAHALPETPSSDESAESTAETSFHEDNKTMKNRQKSPKENISFEDDEDDILKELHGDSTANKTRNNMRQREDETHASKPSDIKSPSENKAPAADTSSPNNMKREIVNTDGSKDIWYPNGNLKKISADGMLIRMLYYNKDIKETNINEGTVKYYYSETNTWHTTYLDGLEILEFPNGQIEHRHKNGLVEVHYPNNSIKIIDPRDEKKSEEWRFPDGTHLVQMRNGDKILSLPNGQKEIHTKLQKRREYPDGTVKIVYPDGSTETRYSNGRVRLKDKDGNLVMDTEETK